MISLTAPRFYSHAATYDLARGVTPLSHTTYTSIKTKTLILKNLRFLWTAMDKLQTRYTKAQNARIGVFAGREGTGRIQTQELYYKISVRGRLYC